MTSFLVYTSPAAGHVYPLVPGLLALQQRRHRVHVRTAPDMAAHLRAVGIDAGTIDERLSTAIARPQGDRPVTPDSMRDLLARGPLEIGDLRRAIDETAPDAVLVDTNTYGAAVAAEASGLGWAVVVPSLLPLPGPGIPPYGLGLRPRRGRLWGARDALLWKVAEAAFGRMILPPLNRMREEQGLPRLRSVVDLVLRPDRLLVLTGPPLEYPREQLPDRVRFVGIEPWDPPAPVPAWLEAEGDPWVLVTCSTHYLADEALAAAAVEALWDEPVRVLLTLADAYGTVRLPDAANVRVERFVPHGPVLARSAAVVCPAGMGIVQKALAAGVPVVAVPFGRDQPEVARRVVEAGVGVLLRRRRLTPQRLREAVREARGLRPRVERAAREMDVEGAAARFADAAEELAGVRR